MGLLCRLIVCYWNVSQAVVIYYSDVIMIAMASQITCLTIAYITVYSGTDQRKHQSSASLALWGDLPVTGEFQGQMAKNAEKISIWWRHHVTILCC